MSDDLKHNKFFFKFHVLVVNLESTLNSCHIIKCKHSNKHFNRCCLESTNISFYSHYSLAIRRKFLKRRWIKTKIDQIFCFQKLFTIPMHKRKANWKNSTSKCALQLQSQSNEPMMTKNSRIVIVFVVIFIFLYKEILRWFFWQYVTKNTYKFFNTSHFLYYFFLNN
jgi:hypothetical protein